MAGTDEAGRGCLAGPIVAAAVVFDYSKLDSPGFMLLRERLSDSKRLTSSRREELYPVIIGTAVRFSIIQAGNRTIDEEGLQKTNMSILEESLKSLAPCPGLALVDGYRIPGSPVEHQPLIKGDSRSACIAAASVLAKVSRDRIMRRLDGIYPEYGFGKHVGYATEEHRAAISRHGFCDIHRRSFKTGPLPDASGRG